MPYPSETHYPSETLYPSEPTLTRRSRTKPSLDHAVTITDAEGRDYTWSQRERDSWNIPANATWGSIRGEGYYWLTLTLQRPITRDFPDLSLLNEITVTADDGTPVYSGRVTAFPRSSSPSQGEFFNVTAAGFMSHATDRTFREIYVDRDLSRWQGSGVQRKLNLYLLAYAPQDAQAITDSAAPALETSFEDWTATTLANAAGWYDSNGIGLGSLYYAWKKSSSLLLADPNWEWHARLSSDDVNTAGDDSGNLKAAGPSTGTVTATGDRDFAFVEHYYTASSGSGGGTHAIFWTCLAGYGTHGLTKRGTADATTAQGFYASDVIRDIVQRFCPLLDPSGIEDTSYVINQIAYRDPVTPFDAVSQLNDFHQYELAVWEDRKFCFTQPTVLDDWDWEIRLDDPGTNFNLQGDSIENLANGIVVRYTDLVKGTEKVLTPESHTELADTSELNPANQRGIERWTEVQIPYSTIEADALQIGRAALGEFSRPKAPGEIQAGGHIRDRNGNWQPGSRMKAGERLVISDHANDASRRVTETQWDDVNKTLRITTDNASHRLEGLFARVAGSRSARGL